MRQHAGPLLRIQLHFLERRVGGQVGAVELRQPTVEIQIVREQQLAEVGVAVPGRVVQEQVERSPQVGDDGRVEAGEAVGVLGHVRRGVELQPQVKELAQLGVGALVGQHALGLLG